MTPRTLTAPPTDKGMWRRLLALVHPDRHGTHELFIWCRALHEHVAGAAIEPAPRERPRHHATGARVDFSRAYEYGGFAELTHQAVMFADEVGEPYAALLRLLHDCYEASESDIGLYRQQHQGVTYKTLAAAAHAAGMSKVQRVQWYRIAEAVPLSQRHGGHILSRLVKEAA